MFAIIKTGGKQYRVAKDDILRIERLPGEPGDIVELGEVLLVGGEEGLQIGAPFVSGATVAAEVLAQRRAEKIIVFKKKRRKNHRRRNGHRQHETVLRVTEILTEGRKPSKTRAAKPAAAAEKDAASSAKPAGRAKPAKGEAAPKAPAKKAPAKKAPAKKAAAKKAPAKKPAKPRAKPAKKTEE